MLKRYRYRDLVFWAESGLIRMEDQQTGEFITITRRDALLRAKAINEGISDRWVDEREEAHRLVHDLLDCVKEAKDQGDPTNPEVQKWAARELKRSKSKILLPSGIVPGYEEPKPLSDFGPPKPKIIPGNR